MNVLSIAGSDPSGGAGIQRDMLVFDRLGLHALSVITAVTSQNTRRFYQTESVSAKTVSEQISAVLDDFEISAIKIGMVYTIPVMRTIKRRLEKIKCPIIVDPVIKSTTGGTLLEKNTIREFQKCIIPLAYAITPNVQECSIISGKKIHGISTIVQSATVLTEMGAKNVIVTGVNSAGKIQDHIFGEKKFSVSYKKMTAENHGGGCTLSAALAGYMAQGYDFQGAFKNAGIFTQKFIKNASKIGGGFAIVKSKRNTHLVDDLEDAINEFSNMKNSYMFVPECQINFVYAKPKPKTVNDVFGIRGRIVRTGKKTTRCGAITLGGSRHVASAIIEMCKKFPSTRSAMNIKYDKLTIKKIKKTNMRTAQYERSIEPESVKKSHKGTVRWGVKSTIKDAKKPHDVIYHTGDHGKEPMILIFGKNPCDVLQKFAKIASL